jgi:hypothetical protein
MFHQATAGLKTRKGERIVSLVPLTWRRAPALSLSEAIVGMQPYVAVHRVEDIRTEVGREILRPPLGRDPDGTPHCGPDGMPLLGPEGPITVVERRPLRRAELANAMIEGWDDSIVRPEAIGTVRLTQSMRFGQHPLIRPFTEDELCKRILVPELDVSERAALRSVVATLATRQDAPWDLCRTCGRPELDRMSKAQETDGTWRWMTACHGRSPRWLMRTRKTRDCEVCRTQEPSSSQRSRKAAGRFTAPWSPPLSWDDAVNKAYTYRPCHGPGVTPNLGPAVHALAIWLRCRAVITSILERGATREPPAEASRDPRRGLAS